MRLYLLKLRKWKLRCTNARTIKGGHIEDAGGREESKTE